MPTYFKKNLVIFIMNIHTIIIITITIKGLSECIERLTIIITIVIIIKAASLLPRHPFTTLLPHITSHHTPNTSRN